MSLPVLDLSMLDPGVRAFVAFLRAHGFETTDSGDGEAKGAKGLEPWGDYLPHPHVFVRVAPFNLIAEADRLHQLLARHGLDVLPGTIEASYDPADRVGLLAMVEDADQYIRSFSWRS